MRGKIEQSLVEHIMVFRSDTAHENNLQARIKTCREINAGLDALKKKVVANAQGGKSTKHRFADD